MTSPDDAPPPAQPSVVEPPAASAVSPPAQTSVPQRATYGKILLEVVLITIGVFLALLVDEWRERAEHNELAEASLRRFRTEFAANRESVAAVKDTHVASLEKIRAYFAADPVARARMPYPFMATNPAWMEYTAWDFALATQALAYIEPDLGQAVAHVYAAQRQLDSSTRDITLVMYTRGGDPDPVPLTRSLSLYFGDCTLHEPRLLKLYDEVLAKLDARLGARK